MSLRKEAMKKLDYIFSNGVVVEITGQGRGQGNSNSMPAKGAMLEEWVFKSFSRQGWDCEKSPYWIDMPNKSRFCPDIVLTKEGYSRSRWDFPEAMRGIPISHNPYGWKSDYFQSAAIGQEFVMDGTPAVMDWIKKIPMFVLMMMI